MPEVYGDSVIHLSDELQWLRPVCEFWQNNIERFLKLRQGTNIPEVPYAGTERANISLLAGAVWQLSDGLALEEFTIDRGQADERRWGRADLWMTVGGNALAVEAKQEWQTKNGHQSIHKKLSSAVADTQRTGSPHDLSTLGLVFVTVKVSPTEKRNEGLEQTIRQRLAWTGDTELDLLCSAFPEEARTAKFADTGGKEWFWPGVYMVGSLVKQGKE